MAPLSIPRRQRPRIRFREKRGITLAEHQRIVADVSVAGNPQRFAQEALGHKSKAVHTAYAKNAEVQIPSLEEFQPTAANKVVPVTFDAAGLEPDNSAVQS